MSQVFYVSAARNVNTGSKDWKRSHKWLRKATYSQQYVKLLFRNVFFILFQLKKKAKKTKSVNWLPLGKTIKYPAAGANCLVAGWGKTNNKRDKMSDALMSANVTVIDRKKCNSNGFYNKRPFITTGMICAGSNGKNVADTCQVRTLCSRKLTARHHHHLTAVYVPENDMSCTCSVSRGTQEGHCCATECCSESLLLGGRIVAWLTNLEFTLFSQKSSSPGSKRRWRSLKYNEFFLFHHACLCTACMLHSIYPNYIHFIVIAEIGYSVSFLCLS